MYNGRNPDKIKLFWSILIAVAVITFVLGIIGFALAYDQDIPIMPERFSGTIYDDSSGELQVESYSFLDLAYSSLQLFILQSGAQVPIDDNLPLEIARFLAPVLTISSLLIIFWFILDWIRIALLAFRQGYIVVCGCGYLGFDIARHYRTNKSKVVVIENNPDNPNLEKVHEIGALVIIGDASDETILRRAKVFLASEIYLVTGNDDRNAEVSFICKSLLPDSKSLWYKIPRLFRDLGDLVCHIHFENDLLSKTLVLANGKMDSELKEAGYRKIKMQYFNLYKIAGYCAQKVVRGPFTETELAFNIHPHILIIGFGRMGRSLLIQTVRNWKLNYSKQHPEKIVFTIISRNAVERVDEIYAWYSSLKKYCDINPLNYDTSTLEYCNLEKVISNETEKIGPVTRVYLCMDDSSKALSLSLLLVEKIGLKRTPIIVRSLYEDGATNVIRSFKENNTYRNIHPFPIVGSECCMNIIARDGMREILAKIIYKEDLADDQSEKSISEENTGDKIEEWSSLKEEDKERYRHRADHIESKLNKINYFIAPITEWNDDRTISLSEPEIEFLSEMEHERWCKEKIKMGYVLGKERDDKAKTTPWLIPYNELPEEEIEKDRVQVRKIPELLERANLQFSRNLFVYRNDLAEKIHQNYVEQKKKGKNVNLDDPALKPWDQLADHYKESNLDQTENYEDLIEMLGYKIEYNAIPDETQFEFSEEEIETLARLEHDRWVYERLSAGWIYGEEKDDKKKISPYLIIYDELSEEAKELDREPIRNLPGLLRSIGLGIVPKERTN